MEGRYGFKEALEEFTRSLGWIIGLDQQQQQQEQQQQQQQQIWQAQQTTGGFGISASSQFVPFGMQTGGMM